MAKSKLEQTEKKVGETFSTMQDINPVTQVKVETVPEVEVAPVVEPEVETVPEVEVAPVVEVVPEPEVAPVVETVVEEDETPTFDTNEAEEDWEDEKIQEVTALLETVHNYSYLNCGRHLKNGINRESLKTFYLDFVSYGVSSKTDDEIMKLLTLLFA